MVRPRTATWFALLVGWLPALFSSACENPEPPEPPNERELDAVETRFDEMKDAPKRRTQSKRAVAKAVARARRVAEGTADRSITAATGAVLLQNPDRLAAGSDLGQLVGVVQRRGSEITLRLDDARGPVFAKFQAPRLETQLCWTTLWEPSWLPVTSSGPGVGVKANADLVWWRFDNGDDPPFLVRFDTDGVAIWRPHKADECYRGESLLGLIGGGLSTVDYLSPVAPTDGVQPDETEETDGAKPLRIDILDPGGKETITARDGVVELLSAKKKLVHRWKTTLRGGAPCTQAAYHRFLGDPVRLYFEIEFTNDPACDEGASRREVQQTLFELRDGELVQVVSGGTSETADDDGASAEAVDLDIVVQSGDGRLRYVGRGSTVQSDVGGDEDYDCSVWASDVGYDAAETGYSRADFQGTWTFELPDRVVDIGAVRAQAATFQCSEAHQ